MQIEAMHVANIKKAMKEHRFAFQFGSTVHNGSELSLHYANVIIWAERCYLLNALSQTTKQTKKTTTNPPTIELKTPSEQT